MQGTQNENFPYVYYTPTYGYAQSPYNPYNPYIPGAMIGVDGPIVGAEQFYAVSPYQNAVSSSAYIPFVLQPDTIPSNPPQSLFATGTSINKSDGQVSKNNFNSTSGAFANSTKSISNTKNPSSMMSRGSKSSVGPSKQAATKGSNPAGGFPSPASSNVLQVWFFVSQFRTLFINSKLVHSETKAIFLPFVMVYSIIAIV